MKLWEGFKRSNIFIILSVRSSCCFLVVSERDCVRLSFISPCPHFCGTEIYFWCSAVYLSGCMLQSISVLLFVNDCSLDSEVELSMDDVWEASLHILLPILYWLSATRVTVLHLLKGWFQGNCFVCLFSCKISLIVSWIFKIFL